MPPTPSIARVFLSYCRKDQPFAVGLRGTLLSEHVEVFRDLDDTIGGEAWWDRLKSLIAASDAIICVLTPNFTASKVCLDEISQAATLEKESFRSFWKRSIGSSFRHP